MDIGPEKEIIRVEPLEDPFKREPREPAEQPAEPAKEPVAP